MAKTATPTVPVKERRIKVLDDYGWGKEYVVQYKGAGNRWRNDDREYEHRTSAKARLGELTLQDIADYYKAKEEE